MSLWLRITLTWLLALALPLQGHSAQSMSMCGPSHGSSIRLGFMAPSADADHADADADDHAHVHASVATPGHGHDPLSSTGQGKCSVCAACCGAVALTSAPLVFEASPAPTHYRVDAPTPSPGTIPDGLERPPRHPLV